MYRLVIATLPQGPTLVPQTVSKVAGHSFNRLPKLAETKEMSRQTKDLKKLTENESVYELKFDRNNFLLCNGKVGKNNTLSFMSANLHFPYQISCQIISAKTSNCCLTLFRIWLEGTGLNHSKIKHLSYLTICNQCINHTTCINRECLQYKYGW